jgi:chromatin segregation and condensation protein Rec8/ScpA/Scc1 (kleisin family)
MESKKQYEQENAMMFARIEQLSGKIESRIADSKSFEQEVVGLRYELRKVIQERDDLKMKLAYIKKHGSEQRQEPNEMDVLSAKNFTIRNKIVKIVSDIDGEEVSEEGVRELIQTIISEIDDCIGLLQ